MWQTVLKKLLPRKASEEDVAYSDLMYLNEAYEPNTDGDDENAAEFASLENGLNLDKALTVPERQAIMSQYLEARSAEAMELIVALGSEDRFFGPEFKETLGTTYHGKEGESTKDIQAKEVALAKELYPQLQELFKWNPKVKKRMDDYLMLKAAPKEGGKQPVEWHPSMVNLMNYFMNLNLAVSGISRNYKGDFAQQTNDKIYQLPTSWLRQRDLLEEEKMSKDSPVLAGAIPNEEEYQNMLKKLDENLAKIHAGEGKAVPASANVDISKNIYRIAMGQTVTDPVYGKGQVTSIANLEDGFVSVAFGPGLSVEFYDAEKIAAPVQETMPGFQCPMDCATIMANACLNGPKGACGYLQFTDDKPSCEFNKACKEKEQDQASITAAVAKTVADKTEKDAATLSRLTASLNDASFQDHDFFKIREYTRIANTGIVRKKDSPFYGTVLERKADSSIAVKWFNGPTTIVWASEIDAVDPETVAKLKNSHII